MKGTGTRTHWYAVLGLLVGLSLLAGCYRPTVPGAQGEYDAGPTDYGPVPSDLRPGYQEVYLDLVAQAYQANPDLDLDMALGPGWTREELQAIIQSMLDTTPSSDGERVARLQALADALDDLEFSAPEGQNRPVEVAQPATGSPTQGIELSSVARCLGVAFLLVILILAAAFMASLKHVPSSSPHVQASPLVRLVGGWLGRLGPPRPSVTSRYRRIVEPTSWEGETEKPLIQFVTTFTAGDSRYDPSVSIETAAHEFLGECGIGISRRIDGKKSGQVTAFEVWLFDKNDIRTATKVLASEYAYRDESLRSELSSKGQVVLARPGQVVELETATLRVWARVVQRTYGESDLPNSTFAEMTVEMAAWK